MSGAYQVLRRARREKKAHENYAPPQRDGYLYYARLKTHRGTFYKLGFTKSRSLERRFSYGGSTDYQLIDKELLFVYHKEAYDLEFKLHQHFKDRKSFGAFSAIEDMPLYRNGQSELYHSDILGLDSEHSKLGRYRTALTLYWNQGLREYGNPLVAFIVVVAATVLAVAVGVVLAPIAWAIGWVENRSAAHRRDNKKQRAKMKAYDDDIEGLINELCATAGVSRV